MLFTALGRSVLGKTVPSVSSTTLDLRPRAILETSGTVFPNTDRPRAVNNINLLYKSQWYTILPYFCHINLASTNGKEIISNFRNNKR